MLYINQLEHRDVPYHHNTDHGGSSPENSNVATSGCGLCSLCMIVDHLTVKHLELAECVRLSEENHANRNPGTDLRILSPVVAQMFDLDYKFSDSAKELARWLQEGGEAVCNVMGHYEGRGGIFSDGGHYIVVVSYDGKEVCILDPDYSREKYVTEERKDKVRVDAPFLYCSMDTLMFSAAYWSPKFYLFRRK